MIRATLRLLRYALVPLVLVLLANAALGLTATSSVPATRGGRSVITPTIANGTPYECSSLTLTGFVTGSGTFSGSSANDLMLGSAGVDSMSGGQGSDCLVAGGGADVLSGGPGSDVCIGGPGVDTFSSCETQIQ